ncbi:MAG: caspase family protein [Betaproteobacteria bacterium]
MRTLSPKMEFSGWTRTALLLVWCFVVSVPASAYDDRVALVIGNDSYITEPLKNAVNDARAMQKALQDLGFKVVFKPNADIQTMRSAAVEFAKQMDGASAAVFYYAGHGIQYSNKNYLIPIDAKLMAEQEIAYFALEVNQILDSMEEAKVRHKFIILDACRNNPFRNLNLSTGLAKSSRVPQGTTISYAAAAGAVALDGDGENGLYTKHLVREIRNPGVTASGVFEKVGSAVAQESNGRQYPENQSTSSPRGAFFFAERGAVVVTNNNNSGVSGDTAALVDREFWSSVKDSRKLEDLQAYLSQFPTGIFSSLARSRIDNLKQEKSQQQVAAAPLSSAPANAAPPVLVADKTPDPAPKSVVTQAPPVYAPPPARPSVALAPAPVTTTPAAESQSIRLASAASPVQTSEVRGMEAKPPAPSASASPSASSTIPASTGAPPANQVAVLSPEQKTSLPPVPAFPRMLTGTLDFRDGARYVGEYKEDKDKNQILHGKGEYISQAFRYNGEFRDGKKQGRGVYVWANGDKFDGDFANDQVSGKGKWEFASGDVYVGEVLNAVMVGKGVLVAKNGDKYDGLFADGKPHGQGVYIFANGDKFEGSMVAGRMSGKGIYTNKRGDRFVVPFVDGVPHGSGTYEFANGDRYVGEIQNGQLSGKGEYFHSDGQRSEGNYINGLLNGPGKFYYNNGSWFEGNFEGGLKRAKGLMIQKDGSKRAAEIVDGVTTFPGG